MAVEVNCSSLNGSGFRLDAEANQRVYLELCKKYQVPIIIDSDAHMSVHVGVFDVAEQLLQELEFPEELIINSSVERLNNYFKGRGLHLFDEEDLL